jgi:hypothetical protein
MVASIPWAVFRLDSWEGGKPMTVYEAISLMLAFGALIVLILKSEKNNKK